MADGHLAREALKPPPRVDYHVTKSSSRLHTGLAICFIGCVAVSSYWWKWLLSIEHPRTYSSPAIPFLVVISVPLVFSTLTVFLLSIWAMRRIEPLHLLAGVGIGLTSLLPAAWIALWDVRDAPVLGVFLYAWTAFFTALYSYSFMSPGDCVATPIENRNAADGTVAR